MRKIFFLLTLSVVSVSCVKSFKDSGSPQTDSYPQTEFKPSEIVTGNFEKCSYRIEKYNASDNSFYVWVKLESSIEDYFERKGNKYSYILYYYIFYCNERTYDILEQHAYSYPEREYVKHEFKPIYSVRTIPETVNEALYNIICSLPINK